MTFIIQQTLLYAVPLMIVALAGVFAERSGIINLALEGIMIFGAFIGVLFVRSMQSFEVFTNAVRAGNWLTLQGLELMAMLDIVGQNLTGYTAYNEYITDVIISVIVYLSAFSLVIRTWLAGRKKSPKAKKSLFKKKADASTAPTTAEGGEDA